MNILIEIIIFSLFAGSTIFLGGVSSYYFSKHFEIGLLKKTITQTLVAFGAGIMLAAVAFVLIPKGSNSLSVLSVICFFILGTVFFYFLTRYIKQKSSSVSQVMAMLLDFVPESIALGAMFAHHHETGILLAIIMAFQNFPEAFNAYAELKIAKLSSKKTLLILFALSFLGVLFSLLGYFFLRDIPSVSSSIMIFASGGILYLIFQDIAPALRMKENSIPEIGLNMGFLVGLICNLIV